MDRTAPLRVVGLLLGGLIAGCGGVVAPRAPPSAEVATAVETSAAGVPTSAPSTTLDVSPELALRCRTGGSGGRQVARFGFDDSIVADSDRALLDEVAACVTSGPLGGRRLRLVGRADPRGAEGDNMALGLARANAVYHYLVDAGVSPEQIEHSSRGELDATGTEERGWQQDRRVDIELR